MIDEPTVDRRKFIEDQFLIRAKEEEENSKSTSKYIVPFKLNKVQAKYYNLLLEDYNSRLDGVRDIILKARQEGFSSFVLALFTVDFIIRPHSVNVCISYKADETRRLFRRVKLYLESYCLKNDFDIRQYLSMDTKEELENATNGAYFYIGTAGAKVGGRGGTITNLHFSEASFFEDTEKITAKEIIEATREQVPQDHGMVFIESTGGHFGSYYQEEWARAKRGETNYKTRFFSWKEFYTTEWIKKKEKDFQTEEDFKSHYPSDELEAFLFSGRPFFNRKVLEELSKNIIPPIESGRLAPDGQFI